MRRFLILLGLCGLTACGTSRPAPLPSPLAPLPSITAEQCFGLLRQDGVVFEPLKPFSNGRGCGIADGVKLAALSLDVARPVATSCQLALVLRRYELEIVQPEAVALYGQGVVKIFHAGSYNCRRVHGTGRLSEHAKGRAIDIIGFQLANGTIISVHRDWSDGGRKSRFLHTVGHGACRLFSVVLGPGDDEDHEDHLHMDIGPYRYCGV